MYNYTSLSLFPEYEQAANKDLVKIKAKERWGERKNKNFGLELCSGAKFCGKYGIPQINAYNDGIPKRFITFSEITSMGSPYIGVTSSDYDYVLEELWNNPQTYTATLAKYKCFAVPDFSLRVGDPLSVQIANTYRNHAIQTMLPSQLYVVFSNHERYSRARYGK